MLLEGVEQYLAEIARILKPSGKCAATFYLINLTAGDPFYNHSDVCYIDDENEPEHGVVYIGYITPKAKLEGREAAIFAERQHRLAQARAARLVAYQIQHTGRAA
jgi:hypothetical protein